MRLTTVVRNIAETSPVSPSQKTCLVADDHDVVRRVVGHMLRAFGMGYAEATTGADALAVCATSKPDAILLDWILPDQSGLACLDALRRTAGGARTPVIYCMSENDHTQFARALAVGADAVIIKPFDRATLHQKLVDVGVI